MSTPAWTIECDYMETCNCDFACSCNFSGFPNFGRCEALVGYHIRNGQYGDVHLDHLDFIYAASWPRAIHQGDGTFCVYISQTANDSQRQAIADIAYGRAGGNGAFAVFAATMRYKLAPQFVPIDMHVDGKRSRFAIPEVLSVELSPHYDPVSGNEHDVEINLPNGFIWKTAHAIKTRLMKITTPNLNFDHSGRNAFYTVVKFNGP
jgi:hypothetical protein